MDIVSWQAQLRKGAAELVVLCLLEEGEDYGANLMMKAGHAGGVISDGSLYPLLKRLELERKVKARWVLDDEGKAPRKFYQLTDSGREMLVGMKRIWGEFSASVTSFTEGRTSQDDKQVIGLR